jgi:glycerol-3-phosphate dehydrogenase
VDFATVVREVHELPDRWLRVYGSRARDVAELAKRLNTSAETAETVFAFQNEFAQTLADCFLRRTMIGLNADLGLGQLESAAEVGKRFMGWTAQRARVEVENYKQGMSNRLGCGFHNQQ